jgi:NADP-dependent 3-hydroxy acid dehydrogenase YdfG
MAPIVPDRTGIRRGGRTAAIGSLALVGDHDRLAVVTGASSGIGAATARQLARAGYEVVAVARRRERIEALAAEIGGRPAPVDLTDPEAVARFVSTLDRCSVLVNNAGGAFGLEPVAASDDDDWQRMWDINVMATVRLTRSLLPLLVASGDGVIVTVTSTAAQMAYEGGGGYCAAKYAERAVVETLRLELVGQPVRICEIAPGMVKTDEFSLNRLRGDVAAAERIYAGVAEPLVADDVADAITWMVTRPSHVNIDSLTIRPRAQAAQHKVHREPAEGTR